MFNCVDCGYYSDTFSGDVSGISQGAFTYYARCPARGSGKVTIHGPENAITITLRKNNGYILWSRLPIQQTGLLSQIKLSLKKATGRFDLGKPGHEVSRDISSVLTDEDKSEGFSIMDRDGQVAVLRWSKTIASFSKAISVETMRAMVELIRACEETGRAQKAGMEKIDDQVVASKQLDGGRNDFDRLG